MRIISGRHKGRRIIAPKKLPSRPTTDQAKEGLFNVLWNHYDFKSLSVLDLFSGTGNISYEFASRGATNIVVVDSFYNCIKFIKKTVGELNLPIKAIKRDVYSFLKDSETGYDLVFADPPYDFDSKQFEDLIDLVFEYNRLEEEGELIVEHSKHTDLSNHPNFFESRDYGNTKFSFFKKK